MRKRISPTIMERAAEAVLAFKQVLRKLDEQVTLRGQSPSTLHNYSRRIALFVLHFNALPEQVAISNDHIRDISKTHVKFIAKDYRDRGRQKPVSLTGVEFLRRLCQHVFPKGFVRIRRFGIYHPTTIRSMGLQFNAEEEIPQPKQQTTKQSTDAGAHQLADFDPGVCQKCKKGRLIVMAELPRIRSPAASLHYYFPECYNTG